MPGAPASLVDALGPGRLEAHFQPVVDCRTGAVRAVEALARWRTVHGTLVDGLALVALAERAGVCPQLDAEMLMLSVTQVAAWRRLPRLGTLELHANLSPVSLLEPSLPARVARVCRQAGLATGALWLELTETAAIDDLPRAASVLTRLRLLGVRIWVDDFGARYASLSYLKQLPIDGVKIDRSFISDIETSDTGRAIVGAVVAIASRLALRVIAEGIENEQQAELVRGLGVDATQGFHHGAPQHATTIDAAAPHPLAA